jgi:hypothetical protein
LEKQAQTTSLKDNIETYTAEIEELIGVDPEKNKE